MNAPALQSAPRSAENIIAVASGKGGVGKTWFSITLAHLFARSGRRTLLFDGDIGLANVDVQLGLTPVRDLGAVFSGNCSLTPALVSRAASRSGPTTFRICRAGTLSDC